MVRSNLLRISADFGGIIKNVVRPNQERHILWTSIRRTTPRITRCVTAIGQLDRILYVVQVGFASDAILLRALTCLFFVAAYL